MTMKNVNLLRNPVLMREMRVRVRGWKAPALVTLYVGILGIVFLFIVMVTRQNGNGGFAPELAGSIYATLIVVQGLLLVFSAPGLTAGAISGERERQTLDLLLVTRMSPFGVVIGKLGAAVGFSLLLMVASLPVYGLLFLFGGMSLGNLLLTALVYVVTVLYLGSIGLYFSALFKRTPAAVVATYGVSFGIIIAGFVLAIVLQQAMFHGPGETPPGWSTILAYVNPLFGVSAAAGYPVNQVNTLFRPVLTTAEALHAIWWKYCLTTLAISAVLLWRTAIRIMPLKER